MTGKFLVFLLYYLWNEAKWFLYVSNFSRYLEKNWEFPETYLGDFTWYLYLGLQLRSPAQYTSAMCLCRQLLDYLLQPFRVLAPSLSAGELLLRKIEGPDRGSTIGLACSRRSDSRAGEKIHEQKKNEGRLEGERGKELSPPFLPPCLFSRGTT